MKKRDGMTEIMTKEIRSLTSEHKGNDGMTQISYLTLLYNYSFLPLGRLVKSASSGSFVRIGVHHV
tara:strand:+ start:69 stop:266 length:198 start_codon:yes stop_codon:yes gene_type:complete